jgi:hypothetical protein
VLANCARQSAPKQPRFAHNTAPGILDAQVAAPTAAEAADLQSAPVCSFIDVQHPLGIIPGWHLVPPCQLGLCLPVGGTLWCVSPPRGNAFPLHNSVFCQFFQTAQEDPIALVPSSRVTKGEPRQESTFLNFSQVSRSLLWKPALHPALLFLMSCDRMQDRN